MGAKKKKAPKKKQEARPKTEDIKILKASGSAQQPAKQQNIVTNQAKPITKIKKKPPPRKRSRKPKQPNQSTPKIIAPEAVVFQNDLPEHLEGAIRNMVRDEISKWELSRSASPNATKEKATPQKSSADAIVNKEQNTPSSPIDKKLKEEAFLCAIRQWRNMKPLDCTYTEGIQEFVMGIQMIRRTVQKCADPNMESILLDLIVKDLPRTLIVTWSTFQADIMKPQAANFDDFVKFVETLYVPSWWCLDARDYRLDTRPYNRSETPSRYSNRYSDSEYDSRYESERYQDGYSDYSDSYSDRTDYRSEGYNEYRSPRDLRAMYN